MSATAPRGFRAAGVAAGLKSSGAPDVALVVNDGPDDAAAAVARAASTSVKSYVGSTRARDERKKNACRRSIS